eukprot:TRINITY_DN8062_c0_g1_i1.p1 TRINITY_DN8062_c0_g1~~TRINITY_DN8062_c0_g1_i1.p1  ORF type:complete len:313 (+),score=47.17 TRINITY_DN8062_c0_g1_i1:50-940(+)
MEYRRIKEHYILGKELGKGSFSVVVHGTRLQDGLNVAVKIIKKVPGKDLSLLHREIHIMRQLVHPTIVSLIDVFEDEEHIYMVIELVTGGMLFDHIVAKGSYSEQDAANIVRQIVLAVNYMHDNGIAHRDLKPENLLCSGDNPNIIKVTDFGLAKNFGEATMVTKCGTPDYVSPEVLTGTKIAYSPAVDVWSIGVVTYILLCGSPPFFATNRPQLFERIRRIEYYFHSPEWDIISEDAKDFIRRILVADPTLRLTTKQCLEHSWLTNNNPSQERTIPRIDSGKMKMYLEDRRGNTV